MSGRSALASVAAGVAAVTATTALAQAPTAPPRVDVSLAKGAAPTVRILAAPGAGPVTFKVATTDRERGFALIKVPDGADPAVTQAQVRKLNPNDPDTIETFDLVASATVAKGRAQTVTAELAPGAYLVTDVSDANARKYPSTVLTVDAAASGAAAAQPVATVAMQSHKYTFSGALPRNGIVRFTNPSRTVHMAVSFKVQNAAKARALVAGLKRGKPQDAEKLVGRYVRGTGTGSDQISPGRSQDITVAQKPGAYVFICFWGSKASRDKPHFSLGMAKAYTVK